MSERPPLLTPGPNPHIQKFMERKKPKPIEIRMKQHIPEDVSIVHYPKPELRETVILCAPMFPNMERRFAHSAACRPHQRPLSEACALRMGVAGKT